MSFLDVFGYEKSVSDFPSRNLEVAEIYHGSNPIIVQTIDLQ